MDLKVKLYLEQDNVKFMGIGVLWLLRAVDEKKSLRCAASSLGISYSKAYLMVSNLEKELGKQILIRQKGGQNRTGASLTPFAKSFLDLYESFQSRCKDLLATPFEDFKEQLSQIN